MCYIRNVAQQSAVNSLFNEWIRTAPTEQCWPGMNPPPAGYPAQVR